MLSTGVKEQVSGDEVEEQAANVANELQWSAAVPLDIWASKSEFEGEVRFNVTGWLPN